MRAIVLALASALLAAAAPAPSAEYPIRAVPMTAVTIDDAFWAPRLKINRRVTIPHIMRQNDATGRVANFLKAARKVGGRYQGQRYNDTDVYKIVEAASYSLQLFPDPALERQLETVVAAVAAAQEPDGYIYPARTIDPTDPPPGVGPERWSYLHTSHELYNAGHLYEAAIAHFEATGRRTLLDVAIRNADLVCRVFGPGRRLDAPGHEEIELALVKLSRVTGDRKYLDQAKFFLEQRGRRHTVEPHRFAEDDRFSIYNDPEYRQDHLPVVEQTRAVGHAVRATYLYSAMTDVAALLRESAYARAVDALWADLTSRRMYLTGGLGSQGRTEAFGADYALPNRRAYAETCASIGGMLWYHRMFLRGGDAAFLDSFERTLYNGYLSGVSLRGDAFFYQNPLESDGSDARSVYFDVACCPANLARLMAQLPGLIYATRRDELFVNLFVGSTATAPLGRRPVRVRQETRYPWDGTVSIRVDPQRPREFTLRVRIPGWARNKAAPSDLYRFDPSSASEDTPAITVNGRRVPYVLEHGFAAIRRVWKPEDAVGLILPMPARRVLAHRAVADDRGRAAIQRGPLVYAIEAADNGSALDVVVPLDAPLEHAFRKDLLDGVEVVTARVPGTGGRPRTVTAVPYFAWANRGRGEMVVWIPTGFDAPAPPADRR